MSTPSDEFSEQPIQPDENQSAEVEETNGAEETPVESTAQTDAEKLPPEARGEANGGPLGCCLGVVAGLFLTLSLITLGSVLIHNGGYLGCATIPIAVIGAIIGGFLGWRIGMAIYREYDLSPARRKKLERLNRKYGNLD